MRDGKWMFLFCAMALGMAAGCGSGSSSRSSAPAVSQGVFGVVPVSGVAYQTATQSGVTGHDGQFDYMAGETISFQLGSLQLGTVSAASQITEFDLALVEAPASAQAWNAYTEINSARSPLAKAVNMASIFQTFDEDFDATNGIRVADEVAARFTENSIDLNASYWFFSNNKFLRRTLYQANAAGELTPRPVRKSGIVLTHLVEFQVDVNGLLERDDGADGVVNYRVARTYNEHGNRIRSETDGDGDGIYDSISIESYNDNHRPVLTDVDTDGDGVTNSSTTIVYNEFGSEILREDTSEGVVTQRRQQQWDSQGNLVRREVEGSAAHTVERWNVVEPTRAEYTFEEDADGVVTKTETIVINEQGEWTRREVDHSADGVIDSVWTQEFDSQHLLLARVVDDEVDGTVDRGDYYTYTDSGSLLTRRVVIDDVLRSNTVHDYAADRVSRLSSDSNGDGNFNRIVDYVRNGAGFIMVYETDSNGDGTVNHTNRYERDAEGRVTLIEYDAEADGIANSRSVYEYENGRVHFVRTDSNGDGINDTIYTYTDWQSVPISAWL